MIPSRAALWLAALIMLPLAAVAGAWPAAEVPCALAIGFLVVAAALDALIGLRFSVALKVRAPESIRAIQNTPFDFPLDVTCGPRVSSAKAAIGFPASFELPPPVRLSNGAAHAVFRAAGGERGRFWVEQAFIETHSPARLWLVRRTLPISTELRIYPDLRGDRTAAALLHRGDPGQELIRQLGRGREFERLRDYAAGDAYDEISWKATARRNRPVVRVSQIERTQDMYVVLDHSRLSARGSALDRFVKAALLLGLAAEKFGDRFGLVTFGDRIDDFVPARSGRAHYGVVREKIYNLKPQQTSPDFAELFTFIQLRIRKRALLVFLTALDDPLLAETFARDLPIVTRRHLAAVAVMADPEIVRIFDGEPPSSVAGVCRALAGHVIWSQYEETRKTLERHGVLFAAVKPDRAGEQITRVYERVKRRQLL